jgi:hypothetical protein
MFALNELYPDMVFVKQLRPISTEVYPPGVRVFADNKV